jgi:hypothetical protein
MTYFKEGGVYVDDETKAVYIAEITMFLNDNGTYQPLYEDGRLYFQQITTVKDNDKSYFYDQKLSELRVFTEETRIDEIGNHDWIDINAPMGSLRPWQASDEPTHWGDIYDFGDIKVGQFYLTNAKNLVFLKCLDEGRAEFKNYTQACPVIICDKYYLKTFLTRPAFSHYETEGLTLPQMSGVIK